MFKIGDRVSFIDDDINGTIVALDQSSVSLETSDGFVIKAEAKELILDIPLDEYDLEIRSIEQVKKEKGQNLKPRPPALKKERTIPPMEVDLHIHQLTANERGMNAHDKLNLQVDTARCQLEFAIRKRIPRVVFIHGAGAGVLRTELEYLFSRYAEVKFYDADYQKYGLGATEVYIFQNTGP